MSKPHAVAVLETLQRLVRILWRVRLSFPRLLVASAISAACGGQAVSEHGNKPADGSGGTGGTVVDPSALTFTRIVAGRDHFCGITRSDKRLVCIADDQILSDEPGPFVSLDMNDDVPPWEYRCAVKEDGELACFGLPDLPVPLGEFVEVSVGFFNACARRASGELECWVQESSGGVQSVKAASPGFSVDLWSFCSQRNMLEASCIGRDGTELLPGDGSGHLPGGLFASVKAAPEAGCAAIFVAIPDQDPNELGEILSKSNIACFSANGARSKIDGLFGAFDVNINEDGCAISSDGSSQGQVACWGAFQGSVPADVVGPFVQVSVSTGLACVLQDTGRARCWPPTGP